jgi:hypothetical protein
MNGQIEFKPAAHDDGGPAFPTNDTQHAHAIAAAAEDALTGGTHDERERAYLRARGQAMRGLSLRDYFAAKALQGALAYPKTSISGWRTEQYATYAYSLADAMLKARSA